MSNQYKESYGPELTDIAAKNFTALFANAKLGLDQTDPEMVEIFANFAFDDVASLSKIDLKTRTLVFIACAIGVGGLGQFKHLVGGALDAGVSAIEVKEVVYQATAYLGMAKVFDFLQATNEVFTSRDMPLVNPKQSTIRREDRLEKGLAVQKSIFGDVIDQAYAQSPKDQLHIQHFLSANCFGDYFTRKGLDLKTRELVIVSMLASAGGLDPQVKSHLKANLAVGNDRSVLLSLFTQLLPWLGYPRTLNALAALNEVAPSNV
jgi:4-carboxymuconolactone decarboxylase